MIRRFSASRATLLAEVAGAAALLQVWARRLEAAGDGGFPQSDYPASPEALGEALEQLQADLLLVAGKCENTAEFLQNRRPG